MRNVTRGALDFLVAGWVLASGSAIAAPFVRGDVNQDGKVDIADAVRCLGYLFAGQSGVAECLDAADINDSGLVNIADPISLLSYLFAASAPPAPPFPSCGDDATSDGLSCASFASAGCPPLEPPSGTLIWASDCKENAKGDGSLNEECIAYAFADGVLKLTHVSACFNCCADLAGEVTVDGATITVLETETFEFAPCACLCLYDLQYEIANLLPGTYTVSFDTEGGYTSISCRIDVMPGADGSYCEPRSEYPWGEF